MRILAIDPGTDESGWCELWDGRVVDSGVWENAELLRQILAGRFDHCHVPAIEMIASYGMAVGREVFETCVWVGRFQQAWSDPNAVQLVYRRDVKLHLCGNAKAKDPNIRQALIDLLGKPGTKKAPGATYGVASHAWAALGVAVSLSRRNLSDAQQRILRDREAAVVLARGSAWPKNTYQHLSRMVDAVVLELASGNRCQTCIGTGIVNNMGCKDCRCTGIEPAPDRRRAVAIDCDPSDYGKRWKAVFEWLLAEMHQAGEVAGRQLARVLSAHEPRRVA